MGVQTHGVRVTRTPPTIEADSPRGVSLSLLRNFDLRVDGHHVAVPFGSQRLVVFLALNHGRLARIFVAGKLWIDSSDVKAAAALRTSLWRLGPAGARLVRCNGTELSLDPEVEVDVDAASHLARSLLDDPDVPVPRATLACLRDEGELLPDWYEDWVLIERERYRQLRLHALEALCRRLTSQGDFARALEVGLTAVASDPLRESAHRAVAAHLAEGNACEALRQYELCKAVLCCELGVEPSPQIEFLVSQVTRCVTRA
jgi:DNA-binding SARP family transcriptional activator